MSARRRQEAIERFSVPLPSQDAGTAEAPGGTQRRASRNGSASRTPSTSKAAGSGAASDSEDDYTPAGEPASETDDEEFEGVVPEESGNPRVMLISLKAVRFRRLRVLGHLV